MSEIYERLRFKLDQMTTGYPKTATGSEINLLKMLFTEEDAKLFLEMKHERETPSETARRTAYDEAYLLSNLERMARQGIMFRERIDEKVYYSAPAFIVGIVEFQIKRMPTDKDLALATAMFGMDGFVQSVTSTDTPHQRVIPINKGIVSQWPIATFDDAVAILDQHEVIAVADCMCRTISTTLGVNQCGASIETCIGFDALAEYYLENGFARRISKDEAVSIMKKSDKEKLVLQPMNTKDVGSICSCCGDCCAMMNSLKMHPSPAKQVKSSYYAVIDQEGCIGCKICLKRCQIDAIKMNDDNIAIVDLNRCLGCGLCVTTCPSKAAYLEKKKISELYDPPENDVELYLRMAKERGIL